MILKLLLNAPWHLWMIVDPFYRGQLFKNTRQMTLNFTDFRNHKYTKEILGLKYESLTSKVIPFLSFYYAYKGEVDLLNWLDQFADESFYENVEDFIVTFAVWGNSFRMVKCVDSLADYEYGEDACAFAALNGNLKILKWLRGKECQWNSKTVRNSVSAKSLDVLMFVHENPEDCPCEEDWCICKTDEGKDKGVLKEHIAKYLGVKYAKFTDTQQ